MSQMNDYVQIMVDSLSKKSQILDRLIQKNNTQYELINEKGFDDIDWDQFNIIVAEKDSEIGRINEMDDGFQALYDRVSKDLKENKAQYADQIKEMQRLITELEEKSVKIRTGEEKNRSIIDKVMAGRKQEIRKARTSMKVASGYYKTMQSSFASDVSSVDKKK